MEFKEFYQSIKDYVELTFFMNVYRFVKKSGVAPESSSNDLLKTLSYLHYRGWLYYAYEGGQISTVLGCYRIKEVDEKKLDELPEKEEGTILFVAINASNSKNNMVYKTLLSKYLKNNPDITELAYYDRNSTKLKRHLLKRKENEQTKDTELASNATVSS